MSIFYSRGNCRYKILFIFIFADIILKIVTVMLWLSGVSILRNEDYHFNFKCMTK